jgi:hypothetical protein
MAEVSEEFGRAIRQILERHSVGGKKMSYRNAQAKTGVNYQTIQNMEQGIIPLRVEFIRKFADGFKEPRSSLMLSTPNFKPTVEDVLWDKEHYPELFQPINIGTPFTKEPSERPENRDSPSGGKEPLVGGITERNIIPVRLIASGPRGENLEGAPRRFDLLVMAAHWFPLIEGERYPSFRWDAARVRPGNVILSKDGEEYRATVYSLDTDTGEFSEETTFVVIDQPLPEG